MTTLALSYRAIHNKIKSADLPRVPWKFWYAVGLVFLLAMVVLYIYGINELTKGAYLIKSYNREISKLSDENGMLEATFAESGFLESVQQRVKALGFEKTTQVTYVELSAPTSLVRAR